MNKIKFAVIMPIALAGCMAFGLWIGTLWSIKPEGTNATLAATSKYQKMQDIINIIDQYYVDTVNGDKLFEQTISDMLHKLDPHSNYIAAEDLKLATEQIKGEFAGVGVRFFIIRDTICVTNVIENSPSEKAGLKAGDKFISINGQKLSKIEVSNEKVMELLKGPEGTEVKAKLLRGNKVITKTIVRGRIPINSISSSYMLDQKTGFLKIDQFSLTTVSEFRYAANELLKRGMKNMVLDLRNNGGGVLQAATDIADEFLKANKVIVSTRGEHSDEQVYRSTSRGMLENIGLVVLINENSASASEILAGALQDNDRGTIVGRRSFGKGLVQEDMQLRDGSNLRLTIARYYTPTGRCIQKPYDEGIEEYYHDQMDRYDSGELYEVDTSKFVDSLKYTTPKGKVVYGGGGIMPDVFIPLDTVGSSWYLTQLRYSMSFQSFAFDFVKNRRNEWNSAGQFERTFDVSQAVLNQFVDYASKEYKVEKDQAGLNQSSKLIKAFLKAEIARQLWTESGYYRVINETSPEIKAALKQF